MVLKKNIFNVQNLSIIFFILFPAALVAGPFVAELIMNSISVLYLYTLSKKKKIKIKKFFLIFIFFYFYILINSYISDYSSKIFWKNFFYFRYVIFVYAVLNILNFNKSILLLFYRCLAVFLFIVIIDGYFQYFFGSNILGFEKYRLDRISGLFDDRLILGSFLTRLLPLLAGLYLINKHKLNSLETNGGLVLITSTFVLIILSGERTSFLISLGIMFVFIFCMEIKYKAYFVFIFINLILIMFILNKNVSNRIVEQTVSQVNFKFNKDNFFENFNYYSLIFETAYKGFLNKKITGQGAGSFKYFCSEPYLEVSKEYLEKPSNILTLDLSWRDRNFKIIKFYKKVGDKISNGDLFLVYDDNKILKNFYYKNNLSGTIASLVPTGDSLVNAGAPLGTIELDNNQPLKIKKNGCTTHPHNFTLQLLSETGIIGFFYIFCIFIYFIVKIFKIFILKSLRMKINNNPLKIIIIAGFVMILFPLFPSGNFFNNWMSMISYFLVPFYLYSLQKKYD
jgi:O-antigen ligase